MSDEHPYKEERKRLKELCDTNEYVVWECPGCEHLMDTSTTAIETAMEERELLIFICQCGDVAELSHVTPKSPSEVDRA